MKRLKAEDCLNLLELSKATKTTKEDKRLKYHSSRLFTAWYLNPTDNLVIIGE